MFKGRRSVDRAVRICIVVLSGFLLVLFGVEDVCLGGGGGVEVWL